MPEQGASIKFVYISPDKYQELHDNDSLDPNSVYFVANSDEEQSDEEIH